MPDYSFAYPAYQPRASSFHTKPLKEKPSAQQKTDQTKYKTEMCKNWIESAYCRYGPKCQFAHGDTEMV